MNALPWPPATWRKLLGLWLGWAVVMLTFQALVPARLTLARPDRALEWTATETLPGRQANKIYLNEPFLNAHVAWDSEYYLAIAVGGYEDPAIQRINTSFGEVSQRPWTGFWPFVIPPEVATRLGISLSYAFFPFYPWVMRLLMIPLGALELSPIATAALAGVLVSLLGTLAALLALYDLSLPELGEDGAWRAAFYLLIFPSSFFLAQVYTEGLFVGLAFGALALLRRGHFGWAAAIAALATLTRAVGIVLALPLLIAWFRTGEWRALDLEWQQIYFKGLPWKTLGRALVALAPVLAFLLWRVSYYGMAFSKVEDEFFGRGLLALGASFLSWSSAYHALFGANPQAAAYYAIEWGGIALGFTACLVGLRRHPDLAWFGLLAIFLSFASGQAQGMHRYILAAPSVFLFLARLGRNPTFDRVWTMISVLVMGLLTTLFVFDLWTG